VPEAVREALQKADRVLAGSAVVVWAAMLRHRQPLTTTQIIDPTVLNQSAVTSTRVAKRYVKALRGLGLLVERGTDGHAMLYEAVVPEEWPESERQAATDWLDHQPPPPPAPATGNPSSDLTIMRVEVPHDHQPAPPPGTLSAARTWLRIHGPHWNAVLQQHANNEILELWDHFTTTTTFPYRTLGDYTAILTGAWLTYDQLFQAASDMKIALPSPNTVFLHSEQHPGDPTNTPPPTTVNIHATTSITNLTHAYNNASDAATRRAILQNALGRIPLKYLTPLANTGPTIADHVDAVILHALDPSSHNSGSPALVAQTRANPNMAKHFDPTTRYSWISAILANTNLPATHTTTSTLTDLAACATVTA
jgi:hypothetical protein